MTRTPVPDAGTTDPSNSTLPKGRQREHHFLDVYQVKALIDAADLNYRDFLRLLVTTELRMGEACELRWRDVDLVRRRRRIERAEVFIGGLGPVVGPTESGRRVRSL